MGPRSDTRTPHVADNVSGADSLPLADSHAGQMGIDSGQVAAVVKDDNLPVAAKPSGKQDLSRCRRLDRSSRRRCDVYPGVHAFRFELRMHPRSESACNPPVDRPGEPARFRGDKRLSRRLPGLGKAFFLLQEPPDAAFQFLLGLLKLLRRFSMFLLLHPDLLERGASRFACIAIGTPFCQKGLLTLLKELLLALALGHGRVKPNLAGLQAPEEGLVLFSHPLEQVAHIHGILHVPGREDQVKSRAVAVLVERNKPLAEEPADPVHLFAGCPDVRFQFLKPLDGLLLLQLKNTDFLGRYGSLLVVFIQFIQKALLPLSAFAYLALVIGNLGFNLLQALFFCPDLPLDLRGRRCPCGKVCSKGKGGDQEKQQPFPQHRCTLLHFASKGVSEPTARSGQRPSS